jgi:formylglycine-generating enzyme required for sulfatase activity
MSLQDLVPQCQTVPAGSFLMGTPDAERSILAKRYGGTRESYAEESPQHEVVLPAFAIMRVSVTNALYEQWVMATGAPVPLAWRGGVLQEDLRDHPVVDVSWGDAVTFALWLSEQTGTSWQLPTEAQWEKAARGVDGRQFPWGNTFDAELCNVRETGRSGTTPVGMFPEGASPYGVLDAAGNVWEWTRSLQAPYPYMNDDRDVIEFAEPARGKLRRVLTRLRRQPQPSTPADLRRVLRGGCYANPEGFARCACRFRLAPTSRTPFLGFRLIHEL